MTDVPQLIRQAQDLHTPVDERLDMNRELFREFRNELTFHPEAFAELREEMEVLGRKSLLAEQQFAPLDTYRRTIPVHKKTGERVSALHVQELGVLSPYPGTRWLEKPDYLGFQALQWMVDKVFVLNAIINTRVRQAVTCSRPYRERSEYPFGIQIRRRDGERLSREDRAVVESIERFLYNCGDEEDAPTRRYKRRRDDFSTFLAKVVRSTLSLDACPIEVEHTRGGALSGFYAVPGDTVRLCSEEGYEGDDRIVGIQIYDHRVVTLYEAPQLIYEVRNPRAHMLIAGYGYCEVEMAVQILTAIMNTFAFTSASLDRNQIPRGVFQIYGNYTEQDLEYLKRQWNALLSGPAQRWRLPIMVSPHRESGATYTKLDDGLSEMAFAKFWSMLISCCCGLYGMSPEEINSDSFTSRSGGLGTAGQDTAERLASSKDKGLEPLLHFVERIINQWILWRRPEWRKYIAAYRGLHPVSPELQWQQAVALQTRDEARADLDMPPCEDPEIGEAPLDPGGVGIYQQGLMMRSPDMMAGQQPGQGGPGGGQNGNGNGNGQQQARLPDALRQRLGGSDGPGMNPVSRGGEDKRAVEATKSARVFLVEAQP